MDLPGYILIVDDEPATRYVLQELLTGDGHRVEAVGSGEEALECIASRAYDLVLLDLRLTGIGGMEILEVLSQRAPDTVSVVLTGHASLETAVQALRRGAHDYLFKPCKTAEVRASVRTGLLKRRDQEHRRQLLAQLERRLEDIRGIVGGQLGDPPSIPSRAAAQPRFLQRGGLIVDLVRHVITLDGCWLELSPTEFDLLAWLVAEAPRVVAPLELIRQVQGYDCEPGEARDTIRTHVYRIRRKAEAVAGRSDFIRTVRGKGYTISE